MTRREAIAIVGWLTGGVVVGSDMMLQGCTNRPNSKLQHLFEPAMVDLISKIANTILPETTTPGAKQAGVGEFIPIMVRDCYSREDQEIFIDGIKKIKDRSIVKFNKEFLKLNDSESYALIAEIDTEMNNYIKNKQQSEPNHYFYLIKQLTLLGYFTSEIGSTMALRYVQVPGRYDGNFKYLKGEKAWATQ